jgi:hypothetical protein
MRLSDHILAARGTETDLGGFATGMSKVLLQAERFEISDEVARACFELVDSRPSALAAALPLCRLPYETMWLEWRGGLGNPVQTRPGAPVPERQGMLIESMQGQIGFMTLAWVHTHKVEIGQVNISPLAVYFDWRPEGDVRDAVRMAHEVFVKSLPPNARSWIEPYIESIERKWLSPSTPEAVSHFFTGNDAWKKFHDSPREIEAMLEMDRHLSPGLSPHGAMLIALLLSSTAGNDKALRHVVQAWEADMQGEASWIECFLAMLNSKNPVVEHHEVDMTGLNRQRVKRGRPEFLSYKKTRLTMSRSQYRIAGARGVDRETARQHLVRGHFKIRKSGVYWWAPFLRGDPLRGTIKRQEYEVIK